MGDVVNIKFLIAILPFKVWEEQVVGEHLNLVSVKFIILHVMK